MVTDFWTENRRFLSMAASPAPDAERRDDRAPTASASTAFGNLRCFMIGCVSCASEILVFLWNKMYVYICKYSYMYTVYI